MEFIIWVSNVIFSAKHSTLFIVLSFILIGDAMLAILHCMTYPVPEDLACILKICHYFVYSCGINRLLQPIKDPHPFSMLEGFVVQ